ncbi:hypothetical protein F442_14636 [Phytophthora nicotianae P10297]|uniref:Uncharacterized protein n=2 Tax=Phytophthora nicotianae TaxID=4792 RepID=W2YR96_PHYNI|nr:hypothetical protein L916_14282 [Phytophthora nicotianae]ETP37555.1 hypothetical protein F442_14636 [Phytophthora nicotianae P10297]
MVATHSLASQDLHTSSGPHNFNVQSLLDVTQPFLVGITRYRYFLLLVGLS